MVKVKVELYDLIAASKWGSSLKPSTAPDKLIKLPEQQQ